MLAGHNGKLTRKKSHRSQDLDLWICVQNKWAFPSDTQSRGTNSLSQGACLDLCHGRTYGCLKATSLSSPPGAAVLSSAERSSMLREDTPAPALLTSFYYFQRIIAHGWICIRAQACEKRPYLKVSSQTASKSEPIQNEPWTGTAASETDSNRWGNIKG